MLELFLKAVDRLIEVLRIREKRLAFRYVEIYKPAFVELEAVHLDYLQTITGLRGAVTSVGENHHVAEGALLAAAKTLAERRIVLAPARAKLARFYAVVDNDVRDISETERAFLIVLAIYFKTDQGTNPYRKEVSTDRAEHRDRLSENDLSESVSTYLGLLLTLEEAIDELRRLQFEADAAAAAGCPHDPDSEQAAEEVRCHLDRQCEDRLYLLEKHWRDVVDWYNKLRFEVARHPS